MQHDPLLHLVKFNILFIFLSMTKNRLALLPSAVVLLSKVTSLSGVTQGSSQCPAPTEGQ